MKELRCAGTDRHPIDPAAWRTLLRRGVQRDLFGADQMVRACPYCGADVRRRCAAGLSGSSPCALTRKGMKTMDGETKAEELRAIPLEHIDESTSNPRKRFNRVDLEELAQDLKANGQLQPVRVRPRGARFELVIGARRLRALALAGIPTASAIVREYSDREVLEVQLSENAQRSDVHPLEEADAYVALRDAHGASVDEIAAKVARPVSHVRTRWALAGLTPAAREAYLDDKLSDGIALLVARLTPERQAEALKAFLAPHGGYGSDGTWTVSAAAAWIRRTFHRRLALAPFEADDATLTDAGACKGCPKNTATQGSLFADLHASEAECTDGACWAAKELARWERLTSTLRAEGKKVLTPTEAAEVLQRFSDPRGGYVRLTGRPYEIQSGRKTWAELLKKAPPPTCFALDQDGTIVELIAPDDLKAAKKACGVQTDAEKARAKVAKKDSDSGETSTKEMTWQERQKFNAAIGKRLGADVAVAAMNALHDMDERTYWVWLTEALTLACPDATSSVVHRLNLQPAKGEDAEGRDWVDAALTREAALRHAAGNRALIAELLASAALQYDEVDDSRLLSHVAKFYGIDVTATIKAVLAELMPPKEPAPAKATKKAPAKKSAKGGAK